MSAVDTTSRPGGRASRHMPGRVDSSTKVNVALPFSQFKIQEPSDHVIALTALVQELADVVAKAVPCPETKALQSRAHELAGQLH